MNFNNIGGSNQGGFNQFYMLAQNPLVQATNIVFSLFSPNYWNHRAELYSALDITDVNLAIAQVDQIVEAEVSSLIQKLGLGGTGTGQTMGGVAGIQRTGT